MEGLIIDGSYVNSFLNSFGDLSIADKFCEQLEPRSDLTERLIWKKSRPTTTKE